MPGIAFPTILKAPPTFFFTTALRAGLAAPSATAATFAPAAAGAIALFAPLSKAAPVNAAPANPPRIEVIELPDPAGRDSSFVSGTFTAPAIPAAAATPAVPLMF